jgi:hypothetical protein
MNKARELVRETTNLACEISYEIDQDMECFHEESELYQIIGKLEKLKQLLFKAYKETKKEGETNE